VGKFILKTFVNGALLFGVPYFFSGFILTGGLPFLIGGALLLTLLYTLLRPALKLLFIPLVWLTFGLFNIVISIFLLWVADAILPQLTITNFSTLFWVSLIFAIVNALI